MTMKYFRAYYKALTRKKKRALAEAGAVEFGLAVDTMMGKFGGGIVIEDDEVLFAVAWIREHCPVTVELIDEQLSHDQTTDNTLSDFHRDVIEKREREAATNAA